VTSRFGHDVVPSTETVTARILDDLIVCLSAALVVVISAWTVLAAAKVAGL
jgi:hypothetical protein